MGWDVDGPPAGLRGAFRLETDARLAAAAPDLLEALEGLHKAVYYRDSDQRLEEAYRIASVAIAKARGGSMNPRARVGDPDPEKIRQDSLGSRTRLWECACRDSASCA